MLQWLAPLVLYLLWSLLFAPDWCCSCLETSIFGYHSNPSVVVELISLKTGRLVDSSMFLPLLGIHWIPVIQSFGFPHEIVVLILEFLFKSASKCMQSSLCSEARRSKLLGNHLCWQSDNKSSIILLGCVCVMKCCSQACCSFVMVDCSMGSTSQKWFKLCSRLLSSRSRNIC